MEGTSRADKDYRGIFDEEELDEVIAALEADRIRLRPGDDEPRSARCRDRGPLGRMEARRRLCADEHDYEDAPEQLEPELVLERSAAAGGPDPKVGQHLKYERMVLEVRHRSDGRAYDTLLMSYLLDPAATRTASIALAHDCSTTRRSPTRTSPARAKSSSLRRGPSSMTPPLRRRGRRPHADGVPVPSSRELEDGGAAASCTTTSSCRCRACSASWRRPASSTAISSTSSARSSRAELEELQAQIDEARRRSRPTRTAPSSCARCSSTSSTPGQKAHEDRAVDGPGGARATGPSAPAARPDPGVPLSSPSSRAPTSTPCRSWFARTPGAFTPSFNQAVTATGRLSSSEPEPAEYPHPHLARPPDPQGVRRPEGRQLLVADYSQIELRMLAHMSEEPVLEAYRRGGHPRADGRADLRRRYRRGHQGAARPGKTINFGVLYGMGSRHLADDLESDQGGQEVHRELLRPLRERHRLLRRAGREARDHGLCRDHVRRRRTPALDGSKGPPPRLRRARRGQHADPGHGRRHHHS